MPTSPSSSRSEDGSLKCGAPDCPRPAEIGDSCREHYLSMSARMAATVRDEPHKVTILTNNQEDIQ